MRYHLRYPVMGVHFGRDEPGGLRRRLHAPPGPARVVCRYGARP